MNLCCKMASNWPYLKHSFVTPDFIPEVDIFVNVMKRVVADFILTPLDLSSYRYLGRSVRF